MEAEWNDLKSESLSPPKILIADDDEATRILLRAAITPWGYKVVEARDGEEAWEILQEKEAPQILILDWLMPKLNGLSLCKRINQKLDLHPYIIFLTSMTGTENVIQALEAGADEFMLKPFALPELRIRIFAGERIIKYRNQLAVQDKQLRDYFTKIKILTEERKKDIEFFKEISQLLDPICASLQKTTEYANCVQLLRELQARLDSIIPMPEQDKKIINKAEENALPQEMINMERMHDFFGDDETAIQSFIKTFVTLSKEHLKEIDKAINNKNVTSAKYFFHLLGSASGNSGIMRMYDLCGKAEENLTQLNWIAVTECYKELKQAIDRLEKSICS